MTTYRQRLGETALNLFGWTVERNCPPDDRYVVVCAPHTSNWDLPITLGAMLALDIPPRWVGKKELFYGPADPVMRFLGGVPVDRSGGHGFLNQVVNRFEEARVSDEPFVLGIAPEGTRSHTERWRGGFYYIARRASVPIALGFIDYPSKAVGIGDYFEPTGDQEQDMQRIRAFYDDKTGLYPDCQGPVEL